MRRSKFLIPTTKDVASHAEMTSHRLMLQSGMIAQVVSGIYTWLPLGVRVLQKISDIIRKEQEAVGCCEVLMPMIQPSSLWEKSGRMDAYGPEMLTMIDRHDNKMLFGPTAEEMAVDVCARYLKSYKDLPSCVFQIQWKFRDEIRPRFGVMRAREFLMKDAYSFDLTPEDAYERYKMMALSYFRVFERLNLECVPVHAPSGPIGGSLSHEFAVICPSGESEIRYSDALLEKVKSVTEESISDVLDHAACDVEETEKCPEYTKKTRAVEAGHVFYFGQKYSQDALVRDKNNQQVSFEMGSYGIGVSRLLAAVIECHHDEKGMMWPKSIAPFQVCLVGLGLHQQEVIALSDSIYSRLLKAGVEVLYDDRLDASAGKKLADADLIGVPTIAVLGPKSAQEGVLEVRDRASGQTQNVAIDKFIGDMCSFIG